MDGHRGLGQDRHTRGKAGTAGRDGRQAARLPGCPGRIGTPDDIANAISFLITDTLITGTVLHAEGGQLLV